MGFLKGPSSSPAPIPPPSPPTEGSNQLAQSLAAERAAAAAASGQGFSGTITSSPQGSLGTTSKGKALLGG